MHILFVSPWSMSSWQSDMALDRASCVWWGPVGAVCPSVLWSHLVPRGGCWLLEEQLSTFLKAQSGSHKMNTAEELREQEPSGSWRSRWSWEQKCSSHQWGLLEAALVSAGGACEAVRKSGREYRALGDQRGSWEIASIVRCQYGEQCAPENVYCFVCPSHHVKGNLSSVPLNSHKHQWV